MGISPRRRIVVMIPPEQGCQEYGPVSEKMYIGGESIDQSIV